MAVYVGQVSSKNGLGKMKNVVATDEMDFAIAYGISGKIGDVYSNRKIGMLRLEGENKHSEVAIDPSEMNRIESLNYAKSHTSNIVNYGAMANALMQTNRTEMLATARSINSQCNVDSLSDEARAEIVKILLGVGDVEVARSMIVTDDVNQSLLDTIKRTSVQVHYIQTASVGGVEFSIFAQGSTSVKISESAKTISVRLVSDFHVAGSASSAGAKYKDNFKNIKTAVSEAIEKDELERTMKYDPNEDVSSTASNIQTLLSQTARTIVRRAVGKIEKEFEDLEPFNPASTKSKIWRELNLSTADIPNSGVSEESLRAFALGEITALQFASDPENGLSEKISKFLHKLLDKASVESLQERIQERISSVSGESDAKEVQMSIEKTLDELKSKIASITNFDELYDLYTQSNSIWETEIIDKSLEKLNVEDKKAEGQTSLNVLVENYLKTLVYDETLLQYQLFKTYFEIEDGTSCEQPALVGKVVEKFASNADNIIQEMDIINIENYKYVTNQYYAMRIKPRVYDEIVGEYDFISGKEEGTELLVSLLVSTEPYKIKDRTYWHEQVSKLARMKEILYFAKEERLNEFVMTYAEDFMVDTKQENGEDEMSSKRKIVENTLRSELDSLTTEVYEFMMQDYRSIASVVNSQRIAVDMVVDKQVDMSVDDCISELGKKMSEYTEDELADSVREFVGENYDSDYLRVQLDKVLDHEAIKQSLMVEMLAKLIYDGRYDYIDRPYWIRQLRTVQSNEEFANLVADDDVDTFIEKYCGDIGDQPQEDE